MDLDVIVFKISVPVDLVTPVVTGLNYSLRNTLEEQLFAAVYRKTKQTPKYLYY